MTRLRRAHSQLLFIGLALLANGAATMAANAQPRVRFFAVLDMTVTVTAIYYWLVVRPGYRGKASLVFVGLLGLLRASFAFPGLVPGREWIAGLAEIALLAGVVLAWRRTPAIGGDPVARLRQMVGRVLATEFAVLYYAFSWRARPHVPEGSRGFTLHQRSGFGDILFFVGLASLLEIVPVHLVLSRWSPVAAWVLSGLSIYGAIWVVAIARSLSLRPLLVSPYEVVVRFGLLFHLVIPREALRTVGTSPVEGAVQVPRRNEPNLYLEFDRELKAERVLGLARRVRSLGICADEPAELLAALRPE